MADSVFSIFKKKLELYELIHLLYHSKNEISLNEEKAK